MKTLTACLAGSLLLVSGPLRAQENIAANPTRPSATDNAYLTTPGYGELEIGYFTTDNFWTVPALLKFGLHEHMELAAAMVGLLNNRGNETEIGDPGVQLKLQALRRPWGAVAVLGRADWAGPSSPGYTTYLSTSVHAGRLLVDTTLGGAFFETDAFIWAVAAAPKLRSRWGGFAEVFGSQSSDSGWAAVDFGVNLAHSPRVVYDVALTFGLDADAPDWIVQLGMTAVLFHFYD